MAYVYRHIRLDKKEPFYIGLGSDSNYSRAFQKKSRNKHWHNIVNISEYKIEIILDNLTFEEACLKEKEFIDLYGRKDKNKGSLVNWTDGGQGTLGWRHKVGYWKGKKLNEETCKKISEAAKLRTGEKNPFYGKKHSEKTKELIKASKLNSKLSEETRLKISESLSKSEKFKNRELVLNFGKDNHKSKRVINTQTGEIYENLRIASEITNINYSKLRSYCQGKVKSKINWKYFNIAESKEALGLASVDKIWSKDKKEETE